MNYRTSSPKELELGRPERNLSTSAMRGMRNTCPSCGKGHLFEQSLTVKSECGHCGEELHHHRADDLPAYLNIFVVGHVVVGAMMIVMAYGWLSLWPLTFLTVAIAIVLAVLLMRPIKGMVVGVQWALRMHGFGGVDD